jgi:hypothetical protein
LLADALYRILQEDQGIICQGINEDGRVVREAVWRSGGRLNMIETKNYEIPLGSLFHMNESEGHALTAATFDNGLVMEL